MHRIPLIASAAALAAALGAPAVSQQLPEPEGVLPGFGTMPGLVEDAPEAPPAPSAPAATPAPEGADAAEGAQADAPDEAPEPEGEAPAPLLGMDGPLLQQPGEAPPGAEIVVRETFGEWEVHCTPGEETCFLYQLALDADENPVAEFRLFRIAGGGEAVAGAEVVTPLGTLLPAGLVLRVDGGEARQYPFTFCSQIGCIAQIAFTEPTVASLRRGRSARLVVSSIGNPEDPVELDISLMGFTAAYNSIEPQRP